MKSFFCEKISKTIPFLSLVLDLARNIFGSSNIGNAALESYRTYFEKQVAMKRGRELKPKQK
jgi:hypothetical protein